MARMLKRSFSMTAILRSSQLVKTPIQVHGIEGRYAAALYSAAHKQNKLDQVDKDLQTVRDIYRQNQQFKDFVLDPTLKAMKKKATIQAIAQKIGLSTESGSFLILVIAKNFLGLLAENGRLGKLEAVVTSYENIMRAHRGELFIQCIMDTNDTMRLNYSNLIQITSAEPLSKQHEQALNDALNKVII
uniref:Oligomycin sensitivity conferral protein n=1 Tax=Heterorhabditis bacteriophora TaxID=37862 RepID=A0A1I7WNP7_HETBA